MSSLFPLTDVDGASMCPVTLGRNAFLWASEKEGYQK